MIIDCFPFFNELDVMEIRLRELAPYVDHFVIAEGTHTHTGKPKPLYIKDNMERFKEFNIQYLVVPFMPGKTAWQNEVFGREYMLSNMDADLDDLLLISDADEIPNLKGYNGEEGVFDHEQYLYFLNSINGRHWKGTFAVKYKNVGDFCKTVKGRVRYKRNGSIVGGLGWHFSSIGSSDRIKEKIEACAHQEINIEEYKKSIDELRISKNLIIRNDRLPEWLMANRSKFPNYFR